MRGVPVPAQKRGNEVAEQPRISAGACCVAGCKLPGTTLASTTGGSDWLCRLHFGAAYSEHPDITMRANNRIGLYRLALGWINEPPGTPVSDEIRDTLRRFHRESLLSTKPAIEGKPLTLRTLATAVLSVLDAECRDQSKPDVDVQPQQSGDTWTHASDAASQRFA